MNQLNTTNANEGLQLRLNFDPSEVAFTQQPASTNPGVYIEASDVVFAPNTETYEQFVLSKLSKASTCLDTLFEELCECELEVKIQLLLAGVLGLSGEAGEVVDHVKKVILQGKPFSKEKIVDELGDVCFYLQAIMASCGTSFTEVIEKNREKLNNRYPKGFSVEQSENRE